VVGGEFFGGVDDEFVAFEVEEAGDGGDDEGVGGQVELLAKGGGLLGRGRVEEGVDFEA